MIRLLNKSLPRKPVRPLLLVALVSLLAGGCVYPISARKVPFSQVFKESRVSALTRDDFSTETRVVLRRFDLEEHYQRAPAEALMELHRKACTDERRELLLALAELSYAHGQELREKMLKSWEPEPAANYFLSSAIYAYLYIFGRAVEQSVGQASDSAPGRQQISKFSDTGVTFDPHFRLACDLYNLALARAFIPDGNTNGIVVFGSQIRSLPPGNIRFEFSQPGFPWDSSQFARFLAADHFVVRGLTVRNEQGELGATLLAAPMQTNSLELIRYAPASLILRLPAGASLQQWSAGQTVASLELYSGFEEHEIEIAGRKILVRRDVTAPLAYTLNNSSVWTVGRRQFFSSEQILKSDVYPSQPYEPGHIPVVFVHGTFSSPIWWAEMVNTLRADPVISRHFQLWYYLYNSGGPVLLSAADFRDALTNIVHRFDPNGKDPALQQVVVIGHSQGGLLAKLAVTKPGDTIWEAVTDRPFNEVKLTPKQATVIGRCFFFDPVPFVKRVVFISTPHRGSFLATAFVRNLAAKFMSLPVDLIRLRKELTEIFAASKLPPELRAIPSSLNGMSPKNPVLLKVADTAPAAGVTAHSIIAVKGNGDPAEGNDGVVRYSSAHVPYAESEFIVRSSHSCQDKPATIEEVRRILLEHLSTLPSLEGAKTAVIETEKTKPHSN
jgi:pimeloyl-ACP methyl ester carboxylesterase